MTAHHFGLYALDETENYRPATGAEILLIARWILDARFQRGTRLDGLDDAKTFVSLRLGHLAHEVFGMILLDADHRMIEFREMFRGTLTSAAVYPREIIKEVLQFNAAAVILVHNHPSGSPAPSRADRGVTMTLQRALALVEVHLLDHLVVGAGQVVSFAERGLLCER